MSPNKRIVLGIGLLLLALIIFVFGLTDKADARLISGTVAHNHSSTTAGGSSLAPATIAMTDTLSSTKACASSYSRIGPNLCWFTGAVSYTSVTTTCTGITIPSSDTKGLILEYELTVGAANAVAQRFSSLITYTDVACSSNAVATARHEVREFNATVATTTIAIGVGHILVPTSTPFIKKVQDAGGNDTARYMIRGYFD